MATWGSLMTLNEDLHDQIPARLHTVREFLSVQLITNREIQPLRAENHPKIVIQKPDYFQRKALAAILFLK